MPADYEELRRAAEDWIAHDPRVLSILDERGEHVLVSPRPLNPSTILALLDDLAKLRAGVGEAERALDEIANEHKVYTGHGDYEIVPYYTGWDAQMIARAALSRLRALDGREASGG